jgi:cytidylate kinase
MSDPTILVTIDPTGEVTVSVEGAAGSGCQALTRPLEHALGMTREDTRTADYYRAAALSARHVRLDSA